MKKKHHTMKHISKIDVCSCRKLHYRTKLWAQFQDIFNMISIIQNPNRLFRNLVSDNSTCIFTSDHICARFITSDWLMGLGFLSQNRSRRKLFESHYYHAVNATVPIQGRGTNLLFCLQGTDFSNSSWIV